MNDRDDRRVAGPLALLSGIRLVLNTSHRFVYPFLPAIARGLGVSLEQAGFLVSARWVAGLATPAVVRAVGRGERHRRLIVAGLVMFVLGAIVTASFGVFPGAVVGFVLLGLAKPVYDISAQAYVAERVPYERRARALSVMELTWAGSLLIGAPAAGWLIERAGWTAPFWVFAALAAGALLSIRRVLEEDDVGGRSDRGPLRLDRSALALLVVVALFTLAAEVMFVVFGAWLEDSFGLSLVALGGAAALIGLAELCGEGATLAFTDRLGKRRAVVIGLLVSIVGFLGLAVFEARLVAGLASVAVALAGFEFTIVSNIPLATEVRPRARARFLSLLIVATAIGRTLGTALGPWLFERHGVPANALVAAAADAAAVVLLVGFVREAAAPTAGTARVGSGGHRPQ